MKRPLQVSSGVVHSLTPADLASPEWRVRMMLGPLRTKPIWIIGSGKTAMDTVNWLCRNFEGVNDRLRCIAGRGTFFLNRNSFSPKEWTKRNLFGSDTILDIFADMFERFNGINSQQVMEHLAERGVALTPFPGAQSFVAGVISEEEIETVRSALSPAKDKFIKAHLIDIFEGANGHPEMKLRCVASGDVYTMPIEHDAFVVNCTDNVEVRPWRPIISGEGLVLCPQTLAGFTGPSANLCTHLWYLGKLEGIWRNLPRLEMDYQDKGAFGISLFMSVLLNTGILVRALPNGRKLAPFRPGIGFHRFLFAFLRLSKRFEELEKKHLAMLKSRYTDDFDTAQLQQPEILGGNAGKHLSSRL